ncbi:hypothetical protein Plhal304r1_c003g0013421 [Plasmopara halstedii]
MHCGFLLRCSHITVLLHQLLNTHLCTVAQDCATRASSLFEILKNYAVGRILTDLTCYPPSCTKVLAHRTSTKLTSFNG